MKMYLGFKIIKSKRGDGLSRLQILHIRKHKYKPRMPKYRTRLNTWREPNQPLRNEDVVARLGSRSYEVVRWLES